MLFIFDLDDTLYDTSEPFLRMLKASALPFNADAFSVFNTFRHYSHIAFDALQNQEMTLQESHRHRLALLLTHYNISHSTELLDSLQSQYETFQQHIQLDSEFLELFTTLKNTSHHFAILTNGQIIQQTKKLIALDMERFIPKDNWFISEQIGTVKPHKNNFLTVLNKWHINPREAIMIGDHHDHDIVPAQQLGMMTCWLNQKDPTVSTVATYTAPTRHHCASFLKTFV